MSLQAASWKISPTWEDARRGGSWNEIFILCRIPPLYHYHRANLGRGELLLWTEGSQAQGEKYEVAPGLRHQDTIGNDERPGLIRFKIESTEWKGKGNYWIDSTRWMKPCLFIWGMFIYYFRKKNLIFIGVNWYLVEKKVKLEIKICYLKVIKKAEHISIAFCHKYL